MDEIDVIDLTLDSGKARVCVCFIAFRKLKSSWLSVAGKIPHHKIPRWWMVEMLKDGKLSIRYKAHDKKMLVLRSSEDDEFKEIFLTKCINSQWLALLI